MGETPPLRLSTAPELYKDQLELCQLDERLPFHVAVPSLGCEEWIFLHSDIRTVLPVRSGEDCRKQKEVQANEKFQHRLL